jgi:ABC-2 type transport system ATP-binding protein
LVHATNLTKRYGRLTALHDVSFSIREGEILGLIGPNGSGKTTLFECLGGVLPIDGGMVLQDGRPLTARDRASSLFYLPDGIAPWPSQTVRWALGFVQQFFQGSAPSATKNVKCPTPDPAPDPTPDRTPGPTPLPTRGRTPGPTPLPLGVGHRVRSRRSRRSSNSSTWKSFSTRRSARCRRASASARCSPWGCSSPRPILLADEPFEGLDLRQSRDVAQTLRTHAAAGRTMFLSIHQIGDAARVCDRFVLLSGGRVCGEGTLPELSALAAARSGYGSHRRPGRGLSCAHLRKDQPRPAVSAVRSFVVLLGKEWRELMASRAWWVLLLVMGPLVGVSFISAVRTYAEASGLNGTAVGVGEAFSPLVGIWAPTFSACELAAAFLLPFVAIRVVSGDRQSGALKIELQHPMSSFARVGAKALVLLAGWFVASLGAGGGGLLWRSYGGSIYPRSSPPSSSAIC